MSGSWADEVDRAVSPEGRLLDRGAERPRGDAPEGHNRVAVAPVGQFAAQPAVRVTLRVDAPEGHNRAADLAPMEQVTARPAERVAPEEPGERHLKVASAIGAVLAALQPFNASVSADALKAVAALHNLRVSSQFAPAAPVVLPTGRGGSASTSGRGPSRAPGRADPAKQDWNRRVAALNERIAAASRGAGHRLAADHPLLQEREQLFRDKPA